MGWKLRGKWGLLFTQFRIHILVHTFQEIKKVKFRRRLILIRRVRRYIKSMIICIVITQHVLVLATRVWNILGCCKSSMVTLRGYERSCGKVFLPQTLMKAYPMSRLSVTKKNLVKLQENMAAKHLGQVVIVMIKYFYECQSKSGNALCNYSVPIPIESILS